MRRAPSRQGGPARPSRSRRAGVGLVELLVGLGVAALAFGGAWALSTGLSKRGARLADYGATLREAALMRAALVRDLRNAEVATGGKAFELSADGRAIAFSTNLPLQTFDGVGVPPPSELVEWRLAPGDDGSDRLERATPDGPPKRYSLLLVTASRLRLEVDSLGRQAAVFELSLALPARAGAPPRTLPWKVTHVATPPGRILSKGGYDPTVLPPPPGPPVLVTAVSRSSIRLRTTGTN